MTTKTQPAPKSVATAPGPFKVPLAALAVVHLAERHELTRWAIAQVRFGRDDESAYAVATNTRCLVIARWDDPGEPVEEFGVSTEVVRMFLQATKNLPAGTVTASSDGLCL